MTNTILQLFTLPKSTLVDRKLDKKKIYEHGEMTTAQRKFFIDNVETMRVLASINAKTINIPPVDTIEHRYKQIPLIWVEMRSPEKALFAGKIIQRAIEHPTILIFTDGANKILLYGATKRVNQADTNRLTIENEYTTAWLAINDDSEMGRAFFTTLALSNHPLSDLKNLYESYCKVIAMHTAAQITGKNVTTILSLDELRQLQECHKIMTRELIANINRAKREKQAPKQIELNNRIRTLQTQLSTIENQLEERGGI